MGSTPGGGGYAHYSSFYNVAPVSTSNNSFSELPPRNGNGYDDYGTGGGAPARTVSPDDTLGTG